jgi:hypothetical protein
MNYHFLSDIIAGGFLGASVSIAAVHLAGLSAQPQATPTSSAGNGALTPPIRS